MDNFFDLHVHSVVKNFLSEYEEKIPSNASPDRFRHEVELSRGVMRFLDDVVLHLLRSQSCIQQMVEGNVSVAVASIAPLELGYAGSEGIFGKLLRSDWTEPLDQTYFKKVSKGEISYFNLFCRELDAYREIVNHSSDLHFISRKKANNNLKKNSVGVLFSMEGGHALSRYNVGQTIKLDAFEGFKEDHPLFNSLIEIDERNGNSGRTSDNFKRLFEAMWNAGMDMLYLTLTHLTHISEQYLATHAFGLKLIKHPAFYPSGGGISDLGKEVIDVAYEMEINNNKTPILIDIKHMSLQSRLDFYKYRKNRGYTLPIIASHMGVTGYSIKEWKDAINRDKCRYHYDQGIRTVKTLMERKTAGKWGAINREFTFNPWSINLMDEDIVAILKSGGLIGLNLDVRILGFQAGVGLGAKENPEYLSTAEFSTHFPQIDVLSFPPVTSEEMVVEEESWLVPTKEDRHPLCLCFNIIHIHIVGSLKGKITSPLSQICLGTDFDGLIEPLKVCREANELDNLEYNLTKWMPIAAKAYQDENGGPNYLYDIFENKNQLEPIVRGILHENGTRFLKRWLVSDF